MSIHAAYFDGKTSRRYRVVLTVEGDVASISGEASRCCPLSQLRVSEASRHGTRLVTFPDGAYLEIEDREGFARMLAATGHTDGLVSRLQQSWRATLLAALAMAAIIALLWRFALPVAADLVATMLPSSVESRLGDATMQALDARLLDASRLPEEQQQHIRTRFSTLAASTADTPHFELLFRKSRIGPNALALPAGRIVLTDELVLLLADDEDALMAVLAHELGHLHHRHMVHRLVHGAAVGAAGMALFGDASGLVAALPPLMLDLHYSRNAEREADLYAAHWLKAGGLSAASLAAALERLNGAKDDKPAYLSTHPATAERIARLCKLR
ncbi:M48 family metallopeptidase [Noviherbaspirillum sp. 1P10PC]|uniref:M48 family metallopeptidase n=1 Tax=Noviherbaspirillum sp. 1P10PC TaxID=3132292 RepID=UPI00399F1FC9